MNEPEPEDWTIVTDEPYELRSISVSVGPGNLLDGTTEFMDRARQLGSPSFTDPSVRALRLKLLAEEYAEYLHGEIDNDLTEVVDGLLDIIVIAWSSLLAYIGPEKARKAATEMVRSNLDKVDGPGLPVFRDDGKVIKPPGWRPPDIAGAIR